MNAAFCQTNPSKDPPATRHKPHKHAVFTGGITVAHRKTTPQDDSTSMMKFKRTTGLFASLLLTTAQANNSVHITYHWHLHQPIYWPERNANGNQTNRYQFAADSLNLKYANTGNFYPGSSYKHPRNALASGDGPSSVASAMRVPASASQASTPTL